MLYSVVNQILVSRDALNCILFCILISCPLAAGRWSLNEHNCHPTKNSLWLKYQSQLFPAMPLLVILETHHISAKCSQEEAFWSWNEFHFISVVQNYFLQISTQQKHCRHCIFQTKETLNPWISLLKFHQISFNCPTSLGHLFLHVREKTHLVILQSLLKWALSKGPWGGQSILSISTNPDYSPEEQYCFSP